MLASFVALMQELNKPAVFLLQSYMMQVQDHNMPLVGAGRLICTPFAFCNGLILSESTVFFLLTSLLTLGSRPFPESYRTCFPVSHLPVPVLVPTVHSTMFKGTVSRKLKPMLLYIIRMLSL